MTADGPVPSSSDTDERNVACRPVDDYGTASAMEVIAIRAAKAVGSSQKAVSRVLVGLPVALFALSGCVNANAHASSVALAGGRASVGGARLSLVHAPTTQPLALIEAHGTNIEELVPKFLQESAKNGGDVASVDRYRTAFELVTQMQTYSYSCGTSTSPRTCTGTRNVVVEVMTVTLQGRAYTSKP